MLHAWEDVTLELWTCQVLCLVWCVSLAQRSAYLMHVVVTMERVGLSRSHSFGG